MTVKITFLRHANAGKGDTDQARDLSELGRHQGKTRRNSLADGVKFDKVISSIALRAGRTAGST